MLTQGNFNELVIKGSLPKLPHFPPFFFTIETKLKRLLLKLLIVGINDAPFNQFTTYIRMKKGQQHDDPKLRGDHNNKKNEKALYSCSHSLKNKHLITTDLSFLHLLMIVLVSKSIIPSFLLQEAYAYSSSIVRLSLGPNSTLVL